MPDFDDSGKAEKTAVLERLKKEGREGVVFKDTHAKYVAGRPASGGSQLKFKFYATCSCVVSKVNAKRSVALELLNILRERLDGKATVGVGNCTIPPNHAVPKVGDIVEIRYLYCYKGGSLYQPTYLGIRDDIDNTACVLSQLKYRAKDDEDEA
jgi:bifunctional non-homologous end joining protein LigD